MLPSPWASATLLVALFVHASGALSAFGAVTARDRRAMLGLVLNLAAIGLALWVVKS